jgi:4-carboxymuconolactone decarboxylase
MAAEIEPGDIYPESGFRLPFPKREDMDEDARAMFDRFVDPKSDTYVGLKGPGGVRLHSPVLAVRMQHMSRYIRYDAGITSRERELSVLATARELNSQFEWTAHEGPAREAGISEEIIDAVKHRKPLDGLPHEDAVLVRLAREAFGHHKVSKPTYADALALYGVKKLIDIVALMGNYASTALVLAVFDMQLHPGWEPLLPER